MVISGVDQLSGVVVGVLRWWAVSSVCRGGLSWRLGGYIM